MHEKPLQYELRQHAVGKPLLQFRDEDDSGPVSSSSFSHIMMENTLETCNATKHLHPPTPVCADHSTLPFHRDVAVVGPPHASPVPTIMLRLRGWVRVHLSLAAGHGDVDETAGVCDSLLGAALWGLLLLLWLDLYDARISSVSGS